MKTVLIITDVFPPVAGAGTKRILKFAKFLPKHGWRCLVLTAANERFMPLDPSLVGEVPLETIIFPTYTLESFFQGNGATSLNRKAIKSKTDQPTVNTHRSPVKRIYKFLGRFLNVPDSRILWLPWAVAKGIRLCRREKVDVLLATGPSFTNLIIGACIKLFTARPLLVDVRDAWVADPMRGFCRGYLRCLDAWCERFALEQADRVISTNPFVTRDFAQRYRNKPSATFDTIYNGFDQEDFTPISSAQAQDNHFFTVVHTGRLYAERTPKFFLKALGQALEKNPKMRERMKVIFVGSCETYIDGRCAEDYIEEYGLRGVVELAGRVSRRQSLEYQMQANLLLLVIGIVPPARALTYGISGKLFDYILCQKPILTLANEGATREIMLRHGLGNLFFHEDTDGLREYLIQAFDLFVQGKCLASSAQGSLAEFDFHLLSRRLAHHLDRIA